MPVITIRRLDRETYARLERRAEAQGRTVEEEVCEILKRALAVDPHEALAIFDAIRRRNARRVRNFDARRELRQMRDGG